MQKRARDPSFSETSSPKRAASEDPSDHDTPSSSSTHPSIIDPALLSGGSGLEIKSDSDTSPPPPSSGTPTEPGSEALSAEEQLTLITNFKKQPLNVNDVWYLIDRRWYRRFSEALSSPSPSPAQVEGLKPIDNSRIATPDGKLKLKVTDGVEVEIVPQTAWDALKGWYGVNVEIARKVIKGAGNGNERVEFYVPHIEVFSIYIAPTPTISLAAVALMPKNPHPLPFDFSASTKYNFLKSAAARTLKSSPKNSRFWKLDASLVPDDLKNSDGQFGVGDLEPEKVRAFGGILLDEPADLSEETLESASIGDGNLLALEQRINESSPWPMDPEGAKPLFSGGGYIESLEKSAKVVSPSTSSNINMSSASSVTSSTTGGLFSIFTRSKANGSPVPNERSRKGLVGLSNLGNTCFMNSALQCLSNTTELNQYFLSGVFKEEINRQNPLGMKGQVADAFGVLISQLFLGSASSFSPSEFKRTIARFAPSFSGYQQHDSQELITFALDGLHEDLNRIRQKPYSESPDWNGGTDEDLAKMARICWDMYKKRNDSVIVDLFQGQYKSTLVCPDCGKEAITFDPFLYLTLPLPITKKFMTRVFFIPSDPSKPRYEVDISVSKNASFKQVKVIIGGWFGVDPEKIVVGELYHAAFYKFFLDHDVFSEISTGDCVVFFEVDVKVVGKDDGYVSADDNFVIVPVLTATQKWRSEPDVFGAPFFITLSADQARDSDAIHASIVQQYKRMATKSSDEHYFNLEYDELNDDGPGPSPILPVLGAPVFDGPDGVAEIHLDGTPSAPSSSILDPSLAPSSESSNLPPHVVSESAANPDLDSGYPSPPGESSNTIEEEEVVLNNAASPMDTSPIHSIPQTPSPPRAKPIFLARTFVDSYPRTNSAPQGRRLANVRDLVPRTGNDFLGIPESSNSSSLYGSDDDDTTPNTTLSSPSLTNGNGKEKEKPLLVHSGQGLLCVWAKDDVENAFGYRPNEPFHEGFDRFVDPGMEAEIQASKGKKAVISIEDCLQEFSKEETLGEDDLWYCSNCKAHRAATKKLEIWKVPDILVVHLKRFGGGRGLRDKIDNLIEFPITDFNLEERVLSRTVAKKLSAEGVDTEALGLEPFDEPLLYDLYAVDQHYGGLSGGHYTALAFNAEEQKWYSFDDSRVSPLGNDPHAGIVTPAAYVLFYRRRTSRPIGGSSRVKAERAEAAAREKAATLAAAAPTDPSDSTSSLSQPPSGRASPIGSEYSDNGEGGGRPGRLHRTLSGVASFLPGSFRSSRPSTPSSLPSPLPPPLIIDDVEMGFGGETLPSYEDGEEEADGDDASSDRAITTGSTLGGSSPPSLMDTAEEKVGSGEEQGLGDPYHGYGAVFN